MQRSMFLAWLFIGLQVVNALAIAPGADDDLTLKLITFNEVLAEIRKAQESGDWKSAAWKPFDTKNWLEHLLAEVKRATKREKLELPVEFEKVKPAVGDQAGRSQQNVLQVVKDGRISIVRQSIILADGNLDVQMADGCILIARGAVTVNSSYRNVIIAGQFLGVGFDRNRNLGAAAAAPGAAPAPAAAEAESASMFFSGGILDVGTAQGTIMCGLERVIAGSYSSPVPILLNSPRQELRSNNRFESITDARIPFVRKAAKNPLAEKVSLTQIVSGAAGLVVLERNGVEYVLRPGAAITDERGQTIAGTENWKLQFLGANYALFAKGRDYAGFYVKR